MYEEYFKLSGAPFKLNPDPRFFFGSRSHNKAMAYLHYGLKQAEGFIVITGPVGAGKSMVIGHLLNQLDKSNVIAAQLLTSNVEPDELLDHILSAFRIEPEGEGRTGKLEAFEDYLFDQLNRGKRVLLIMDEAQNLPLKTLEELRMLSNVDFDGTPLFQVFLVGQPEFRDTMAGANMEQLKQRVIATYHLENLSYEETREYILHRLSVVGWKNDPVFSDEAFQEIFEETSGRPRRINTLCNRLMLYCSLEEIHEVTKEVAKEVAAELHEENLSARSDRTQAKPVSMPEVRSVKSEDIKPANENDDNPPVTQAEVETTDDEPALKDKTKELGSSAPTEESIEVETPPKDEAPTKDQVPIEDQVSTPKIATASDMPVSSSGSVFDRLRANRNSGTTQNNERQEATLSEVATAIAAASGQPGREEEQKDADNATVDNVAASSGEFGELSSTTEKAAWQKTVLRSVDDTREDMKYAHARVQRIRTKITGLEKRQDMKHEKIANNLARAKTLLDDIRRG